MFMLLARLWMESNPNITSAVIISTPLSGVPIDSYIISRLVGLTRTFLLNDT